LPRSRVTEVLGLVGLQDVARKRAGGFSLGMGQRLGIAAAMLGDPEVLLLDEPVNGLDPEGVLWVRRLMKQLAAEGRTIFVSSHLLNEMAVTADHLIVIGRGKLIADCSTEEFIARSSDKSVLVRTPEPARLTDLIVSHGGKVSTGAADSGPADGGPASGAGQSPGGFPVQGNSAVPGPGSGPAAALTVTGLDAPKIGELAASAGLVLHELTPQASLEEAFLELTSGSLEFGVHDPGGQTSQLPAERSAR
jgi:ABC-2 type transport system ATP-binding protein